MASPTSWVVSSALPVARTASSTRWPSCARASSVTGRPWHALRTPLMTFVRLNGSVTPLPLDHHQRARLHGREPTGAVRTLAAPADRRAVVGRTTVDDAAVGVPAEGAVHGLQPSLTARLNSPRQGPSEPLEAAPSIGDARGTEDPGDHNFWAAARNPTTRSGDWPVHPSRSACRTGIGMCRTAIPPRKAGSGTAVSLADMRRYGEDRVRQGPIPGRRGSGWQT